MRPIIGLIAALVLPSIWAHSTAARNITYDERSFVFDGKREFIVSGSVHPARVHPGDWPRVISLAQELGLNTIQVYFMWDGESQLVL